MENIKNDLKDYYDRIDNPTENREEFEKEYLSHINMLGEFFKSKNIFLHESENENNETAND